MNNIKRGLPLLGLVMLSGVAAAGETSGQVSIVSEYMFRGIESSNGAALQGSLDWHGDRGITGGVWASNTSDSGSELDLWAGWGTAIGEFGVDLGAIYYYYPEAEENGGGDPSYPEIYVGGSYGPAVLRVYLSNDFAGTDEDAYYVMGAVSGQISDTTVWSLQVGLSGGDGVTASLGEEYVDYSLGLSRLLGDGLTASVSLVGTDLEFAGETDKAKLVLGISQSFGE